MDYINEYHKWLDSNKLSNEEKEELISIKNDENEIKERFYTSLEFGTGGLRGIMGVGSNRMNRFTISKVTQGLANYLNYTTGKNITKSVAIAYDTRNNSKNYAMVTAQVFAANNIIAYLFDTHVPTPMLSFAVRELKCDMGVVITASHNPKEYNGYKVYNSCGSQFTDELANKLIDEINKLDIFEDINTINFHDALNKNFVKYINNDLQQNYYNKVVDTSFIDCKPKQLSIVYTPIHGTGYIPVTEILSKKGYEVKVVENQIEPNGNFPTVKYPNPEEKEALQEAVKLAKLNNADIVLATDPDSDRLAVVVKHHGEYIYLDGNQIGSLLVNHIVTSGKMKKDDVLVKTIVTSDLGAKIASANGASVVDVLTGFKYIGEKIQEYESTKQNFLFGYEESYGYLKDTFVRDKDAVIASVLISDLAEIYKEKNMTLIDVLEEIYFENGYYLTKLENYTFKGLDGKTSMEKLIDNMRNDYSWIMESKLNLVFIEDYKVSKKYLINENRIEDILLPKSNVLKYIFADGSWIVIRPSGTEPKLKIYYQATGLNKAEASSNLKKITDSVGKIIN